MKYNSLNTMNKKYYFSIFSGEVYSIPEEETQFIDVFQIPLSGCPSDKCKKCHGKLRTNFLLSEKRWDMCKSCSKKYIDFGKMNKVPV